MKIFYNEYGTPFAYTDDNEHIFTFPGKPVGYIFADKIYSYNGKHLGWYIDGWIRDINGYCVFFTETATGGPIKPMRKMAPIRSVKTIKPLKRLRSLPHLKPIKRLAWSRYKDMEFFTQ